MGETRPRCGPHSAIKTTALLGGAGSVTWFWMTSATEVAKLLGQAPVREVSRPPPLVGRKSVQRRHQVQPEPVLPPKTPAAVQPVGLRRSLARILTFAVEGANDELLDVDGDV